MQGLLEARTAVHGFPAAQREKSMGKPGKKRGPLLSPSGSGEPGLAL